MFKKYIGTKTFYKNVFILIIPIMFQQLLVSTAGYVDNIMINSISDITYNGVSAANRLMFVITFVFFGLAATSSIFIAQYFGANQKEKVEESVRLSLLSSFIVGLIVMLAMSFLGKIFVDAFVLDESSRNYGYQYIEIMKYSVVVLALNISLSTAFRTIKMAKVVMLSAIIGIIINVILNYCLIFGNFGFPRLEAQGAAIATLISRYVEFSVLLLILLCYKKVYFRKLFKTLKITGYMVKELIKKAIPLVSNELLWSFGMILAAMFYTYKNDVWYNAYAYSQNISDLFFIIFSGLGTGTAVFIGLRLGRSEFNEAQQEFNYFKGLGLFMGLAVGSLMFLTSPLTIRMFSNDPNTINLVINILAVTSVFTAIYCYNAVCFFTLRAGGDSISAFILDQVPTYLFTLPLCFYLGVNAKQFGLSLPLIYLITHIVDIIKLLLANYLINRKRWLKNLTIEHA